VQVFTIAGNTITTTSTPCAAKFGLTDPVVDCTCPAGTFVRSGGADSGGGTGRFIRETRQTSATGWRITCAGGAGGALADVLCDTYSLACDHLGP
jgi:hypothetical protein